MTTINITDTGRPKRDIIEMAFEELGSAGYEFERTPDEVTSALRRLNLMMADWPWSTLPYSFPVLNDGAPTDLSGLPDNGIEAASLELAKRLAGIWRTALTPEQGGRLARAKAQLFTETPPTAVYARGTPRGSGNRWSRYWPYMGET